MKNYICGQKIEAENLESVLQQALFPTQELLLQDTITCIESPGVGVEFLSWFLPISFMVMILIGFFMGTKYTK